jgi:hypothetical protein
MSYKQITRFHRNMLSASSVLSARNCTAEHSGYKEAVRFEVFTVVTMNNGVFWDVTPCGS